MVILLTEKLNGADCSSDSECLITNSVCDGSSQKCSCPAATYLEGTVCMDSKYAFCCIYDMICF